MSHFETAPIYKKNMTIEKFTYLLLIIVEFLFLLGFNKMTETML